MMNRSANQLMLFLSLALASWSCATLQPPGAGGPPGVGPAYPLLFSEDAQRREAALAAVSQLVQPLSPGDSPQLQPITATIASLPSAPARPLYLPKLGTAAVMNEEETRESLRRFLREWQALIGADPEKLSLVSRVDQPDGTKAAHYEQRPFRHPIRGNYGKLEIRFTPDRRILNISSTCIPEADRIQLALAAITPKITTEDAMNAARTNSPGSEMKSNGLVTYIMPSADKPGNLEFHLAWEVELSGSPVKKLYVDAVSGKVIASE